MKAHIMDVRSTRDYDCPREHLQGLLHLPPDELEIEDVLLYRQRDRTTNFQVAPRRGGRGSAGRGGIGGGGGDTSNNGTAGDNSSTAGARAADSSAATSSSSYIWRRGDAVSAFRGSLIMQKEWRDSQMSVVTGEVEDVLEGGELLELQHSGSGRGGLQGRRRSAVHQDDDHDAQDVLGEDPPALGAGGSSSLLGVIHERSGEEESGSFPQQHQASFSLNPVVNAAYHNANADLSSGGGEQQQAGTLYEDEDSNSSTRSGRTRHLPRPQARGPLALTAMLTRPRAPVHELRRQCSNRSGGSDNQTSFFGSEMLGQMDDENAGSTRSGNRGRNVAGATSSSTSISAGARRGGGGRDPRSNHINRDSVREDYADHHVDDHDQEDVDDGDSTTTSPTGGSQARRSSVRRRLLLALSPDGASQDTNSGPLASFGSAGTRTLGPADRQALHRNCPWLDPQLLRAMTDQTQQSVEFQQMLSG
ncbi:unnamed protein product [Amoebophrya sp. A25]|nr:unnamed protein product [Amoebophrya sp. A25]|eukprot:GSA25T00009382001.1